MNNPRSVTLLRPILGLIIIATIALGAIHGEHAIGRTQPTGLVEPPWLDRSTTGSVCSDRYETLFGTGHEDLSQIVVLGLQDCASLENHFDENLEDSNPLVVSLDGDQSYTLATLRSLSDESTRGDYTAVLADGGPLPSWMSFDSEYGVLSASPSCENQGSYLLEQNVAPNSFPGSINPLFVNYEVSCPASFSVSGLDFENDGQVSGTPAHGVWDDSDNNNEIDQPVKVREGRVSPWEAYVLSDLGSSVELVPQQPLPEYVTVSGNRIDFGPANGLEGASGTLEFKVQEVGNPSNYNLLSVPYEVLDENPVIVGLAYSGENGTIDNPSLGPILQNDVLVDCSLPAHEAWGVPKVYDHQLNWEIDNEALNQGINLFTGRILSNFNCDTQSGQRYENVKIRVNSSSGTSPYVNMDYVEANGSSTSSFGTYK